MAAVWIRQRPMGADQGTLCLGVKDTWGPAEDNRLFVEEVLPVRTGCPWRELPDVSAYWIGPSTSSAGGAKSGVFDRFSSFWPAITTTST